MGAFLVRRLLQSALLLVAVVSGVFFLVHITPGGPEVALLQNPRTSPEEIQRLRDRFGLDQPLVVQYARWIGSAAHLDFGRSYFYARPVVDVIAERMGPTLQLGLVSYAIALLGVPLGVVAALQRGSLGDAVVRVLSTVGTAVPTWWLGLTSIVVLSSLTGWFPNGKGQGGPCEWLQYINMPSL